MIPIVITCSCALDRVLIMRLIQGLQHNTTCLIEQHTHTAPSDPGHEISTTILIIFCAYRTMAAPVLHNKCIEHGPGRWPNAAAVGRGHFHARVMPRMLRAKGLWGCSPSSPTTGGVRDDGHECIVRSFTHVHQQQLIIITTSCTLFGKW